MPKKILVTGANGFVGRALCRQLAQTGLRVRGTVRTGSAVQNLPIDIELANLDLSDLSTDAPLLFKGIDTVVHLAARVHILKDKANNPLDEFRRINVLGTEHLAKQAAANGVKRFIFMSSIKVNGEGQDQPYTEADRPSPQDFYGISKWEAEKKLYDIAHNSSLEVVILRAPLVYGPGVKANFLRLIGLVKKRIPLPFASVQNKRSMIYLENLIDAVMASIRYDNPIKLKTYLISDGQDISTPDLIRQIGDTIGKSARVFKMPLLFLKIVGNLTGKSGEINRLLGSLSVDISKIKKEIQWTPPYSMNEGLRKTISWYLNHQ